MVKHDIHSLSQIKAVRTKPLDSGVEVELCTPLTLAVFSRPIQKQLAIASRARLFGGHQIIDVDIAPPGERLAAAHPERSANRALVAQGNQQIALCARHTLNDLAKLPLVECRAQLTHHRKAGPYLRFRTANLDLCHVLFLGDGQTNADGADSRNPCDRELRATRPLVM